MGKRLYGVLYQAEQSMLACWPDPDLGASRSWDWRSACHNASCSGAGFESAASYSCRHWAACSPAGCEQIQAQVGAGDGDQQVVAIPQDQTVLAHLLARTRSTLGPDPGAGSAGSGDGHQQVIKNSPPQ